MKIILFLFIGIVTFLSLHTSVFANQQKLCVGRQLNGSFFAYKTNTNGSCFKYIQCTVNGQNIWVIGGLQGESFTNLCPVTISHIAP